MTSIDAPTTSARLRVRQLVLPEPRSSHEVATGPLPPESAWPTARRLLGGVRAWMVVVPVDAALLAAPAIWAPQQARAHLATALLGVALLTGGRRYRARLHLSVLDELPVLLGRLLVAAAVVAITTSLLHRPDDVRAFLTHASAAIVLVVAGRVVSGGLIAAARVRRVSRHRTVLIGGGALAAELARILDREPRHGLEVAGFVDDGDELVAGAVVPQLGRLADLDRVIRHGGVDVLVVADGDFAERDLVEAVRTPAAQACDLLVVPRMHHFAVQTGLGDQIGSFPVERVRTPNLRGPARTLKRAADVVVAGVGLLCVAPLLAVCATAVLIEGGPGVIFRQPRVGRDGTVFECLKLRSVRGACAGEADTTWTVTSDGRVGPVGRFLRRTSLDELPQLWNILRGDMTLVGPRPERPHFVDRFSAEHDHYAHRHRVRTGLTGLAQVNGLRGDTCIAARARFDNYYIERWSLWLDVKIILRTVAEVLLARGR